MPVQTTTTKAAVANRHQQRWKGKKQIYWDYPEECEWLLWDDLSHDSEDEVGQAGPTRLPTQETRPTSHIALLHLIEQRLTSRSRQKKCRRLDPQVCFNDNVVRPTPPKLLSVHLRQVSIAVDPEYRQKSEIQRVHFLTFSPIVFYEQFKFFFNLYFSLVAISQLVPALKIGLLSCSCFSSPELFMMNIAGFIARYIAPHTFALFVTMGKETYDNYKRCLRDKGANSAKYILEPSGVDATTLNGDLTQDPSHLLLFALAT